MMPFKLFVEKQQRNPLRKKELSSIGNVNFNSPQFKQNWIEYITSNDIDDLEDQDDKIIRSSYENLLEFYPEKASIFLNNEFNKYLNRLKKPSKSQYTPVLEYMGIKVLVDTDTVEGDFSKNSYNYRILSSVIRKFVFYIKDLLPNRKPTFIITDLIRNPDTKKHSNERDRGLYFSDSIFINAKQMDEEDLYVHEYAHHVADQIPRQTEVLLKQAYQDMIDMYYKAMKKGKGKTITPIIRANMSKKLGFPEYGLLNSDEFFAIVIQYWKQFPNNKMTYKFKSLVKNVLTRL